MGTVLHDPLTAVCIWDISIFVLSFYTAKVRLSEQKSKRILRFLEREYLRPFPLHKVFYPCNRCHLATLLENQYVTCGNEVTRVTRNGVFALNIHSTLRHRGTEFYYFSVSLCLPKYSMGVAKISQFRIPPYGTSYSMSWNKVFHPMEQTGRCRLQREKVRASKVV